MGRLLFLWENVAMLMQCLFAVCMLGIVIMGMLVMVQLVTLEELGNRVLRGLLIIVLMCIGLGVLKCVLLPIVISWLVMLKHMVWWLVIIVLAIIAAVLLGRILIFRFEKWLPARSTHERGEP